MKPCDVDEESICIFYAGGLSAWKIAELMNIPSESVMRVLIAANIVLRRDVIRFACREAIASLHAQGWSNAQIAKRIETTAQNVGEMLKYHRDRESVLRRDRRRRGRAGQHYSGPYKIHAARITEQKDAAIRRLLADGVGISAIAKRVGVGYRTVERRQREMKECGAAAAAGSVGDGHHQPLYASAMDPEKA